MSRVDPRRTPSARTKTACVQPDPIVPSTPFTSKSKYLRGLQCHKLLWHAYNAKHLIPERVAHTQAIFNQGHEVGQLAKQLFPGGIQAGHGIDDFDAILAAAIQPVYHPLP